MSKKLLYNLLAVLMIASLVLSACGGGGRCYRKEIGWHLHADQELNPLDF